MAIINRSEPFYIPAQLIKISIPYSGDQRLWNLQPNPCRLNIPQANIQSPQDPYPGEVVLEFVSAGDALREDQLKTDIERQIEQIKYNIDSLSANVAEHNNALRKFIENRVSQRRKEILRMKGFLERLDIPLRRNPNAPSIEPMILPRRTVRPLPSPPGQEFKPDPGIIDQHHEHILGVIRHVIATFETTPATYRNLDERDLRNILLAHLNGHYDGDATGEAFRNKGKTDIRIEHDDRAAFVAECKIWRGPKEFQASIDQLLGYLTWRDSKAAIIVFNKNNRGFTDVQSKIEQELASHSLSKRAADGRQRSGEWRFVFRSPEDERKEVTVHVFAANLFVTDSAGDPDTS